MVATWINNTQLQKRIKVTSKRAKNNLKLFLALLEVNFKGSVII